MSPKTTLGSRIEQPLLLKTVCVSNIKKVNYINRNLKLIHCLFLFFAGKSDRCCASSALMLMIGILLFHCLAQVSFIF